MLQVILLRLLWMREELQVESQKSAQVPAAPLYFACIVGRGREAPTVIVTMPVVSLDDFSLNTTGEGNMLTIVLSYNNNTTCNLGVMASILTECVRARGNMSEFFNKFPDHKNATFEETDAALRGGSLGVRHCSKERSCSACCPSCLCLLCKS